MFTTTTNNDDNDNNMTIIPTQSAFGRPYEERWTKDQVEECIDLFDLSSEQTSNLLELKERVSDLHDFWGNGPFELVRFVLEHTCYDDINIMEKRVRKCVEWRQQNELDTILETYTPTNLMLRFPAAIMRGTDLDGEVLVVARQGDPLGLLQRYGRDELIRGIFWGNEFTIRGPWQQRDGGHRRKRATAILDLKGLCRRHYHPSLMFLVQKLGGSIQTHYPYLIKKVILINAPTIFRYVWTLFKPFIFPHLRALIEVATEAESLQAMEKYVDLKELPECLAPGIGQGKPVLGLNPNWDGGTMIPPPSPEDFDRPPLVYSDESPYYNNYYYSNYPNNSNKDQDSCCTGTTSSSSLASNSVHRYNEKPNMNNNNNNNNNNSRLGHPVTSSATLLMKGTWLEEEGTTATGVKTTAIHILSG